MKKKKVVFVCVENACRSQMAEAFAKMLGRESLEAYSAGSQPAGKVNDKAIASMRALNYDLKKHLSSGLDALPAIEFDWLITMGCGDRCPALRARHRADWDIPDPKNMHPEDFAQVRDLIHQKVAQLIEEIQSGLSAA